MCAVTVLAVVLTAGAAPPGPAWEPPEFAGWLPCYGIGALCFSSDGRTLAASVIREDVSSVVLWEVASQRPRATLTHRKKDEAYLYQELIFRPDGRSLVAFAHIGGVQVWDLRHIKVRSTLPLGGTSSLGLAPDGETAAVRREDGEGHIELMTLGGKKKGTLRGQKGHHTNLVFSPDGKTLASSSEKAIHLWDVARLRQRSAMRVDHFSEGYLTFSPCGRWLASASVGGYSDTTARVRDASTLKVRDAWGGHKGGIRDLAFTPGGRYLVAASAPPDWTVPERDGAVKVWDVERRKERASLRVPGGAESLAVSPDGRLAAVLAGDRDVRLWRLPPCCWLAGPQPGKSEPPSKGTARPSKEALASWADLAGQDAKKAYRAVWALASDPEAAVALMRAELKPAAAPDRARIRTLVERLGDEDFRTREEAQRGLAGMGELAEPALRRALKTADLEARRRAERLLARLAPPITDGTRLRAVRAAEVLELIGSAEARRLLAWLATGAPAATLTQEAAASLARLELRAARRD